MVDIFMLMEAMIDSGVHMGFSRETATTLVHHTLLGMYWKRLINFCCVLYIQFNAVITRIIKKSESYTMSVPFACHSK
jgi:hypothetical protein